MHYDSSDFFAFPLATGQQNAIRYLGMTYYAGTPEANWVAKDLTVQSDRVTFGPSGLFLRLYMDGKTRTRYGIHSRLNIKNWLAEQNRYKSAGCIVVDDDVLSVILKTVEINGGHLDVKTSYKQDTILSQLAVRVLRENAQQL